MPMSGEGRRGAFGQQLPAEHVRIGVRRPDGADEPLPPEAVAAFLASGPARCPDCYGMVAQHALHCALEPGDHEGLRPAQVDDGLQLLSQGVNEHAEFRVCTRCDWSIVIERGML